MIRILANELGLSCKDIAAHVGGTPNVVSQLLIKMRRLLRSGKGPDEVENVIAAARKKRSLDGS